MRIRRAFAPPCRAFWQTRTATRISTRRPFSLNDPPHSCPLRSPKRGRFACTSAGTSTGKPEGHVLLHVLVHAYLLRHLPRYTPKPVNDYGRRSSSTKCNRRSEGTKCLHLLASRTRFGTDACRGMRRSACVAIDVVYIALFLHFVPLFVPHFVGYTSSTRLVGASCPLPPSSIPLSCHFG